MLYIINDMLIYFICLQEILSKTRGGGHLEIPQIPQDCMASTGLEWYIIFAQGMQIKKNMAMELQFAIGHLGPSQMK